jgi:hypothetical protein
LGGASPINHGICAKIPATSVPEAPAVQTVVPVKAMLTGASGARGSHRKWVHGSGRLVIMSGKDGDDAKRYQEAAVAEAIAALGEKPKP